MRIAVLGFWVCLGLLAQPSRPVEDPQAVVQRLFPKDEVLQRERLADVAGYLGLHAGSNVADVGCGGGEVAVVWSRAVGPSGRVYAEDISKRALDHARKLAKKQHARNVTLVQGQVADPRLPAGALDGITLFWVYHELVKYPEMLAHFRQALKPDGRLVIVDPAPHKTAARPRQIQAKNHVLNPDIAQGELEKAGFEILHRDDHFVDDPDAEEVAWILVARPSSH